MIKGSKHTVITKLKISETKTGRYCTPEHKHKLSLAKQGHYVSEETKKKIGLANKGKKLKSPSEETRKKLSEAKKGKPAWNKGILFSEEVKKKMSIAHIKRLQENSLPWKETKPEIEAEAILQKYNLNYKKQKALKYNNRYRLYDFYLPDYNILLEIDGTYWHSKGIKDKDIKNQRLKDCRINDQLKNKLAQDNGYSLIRIWSDEMFKLEDYCSKELLKTVSI